MPGRCQGTCFRFAIAHYDRHNQIGIIVGSAVSMGNAVAQFTAFMNGTRCFGGAVAADTAGERKLLEELQHAFFIFTFVGVNFRVSSFQVDRSQHAWCAMAGARHENGVQTVLVNKPVHMDVGKAQAGA